MIIEDLVYGFLSDVPPLAAQAEERAIVVDSLSKRLAPGIAVGFLHVPAQLRERFAVTVRTGAWSVTPLALAAGMATAGDGTAAEITRRKRADAVARQAIVAECLAGHRSGRSALLSRLAASHRGLARRGADGRRRPRRHRHHAGQRVCRCAGPFAECRAARAGPAEP